MEFILGITAYILYFIYDYNSVTVKNRILQKFFLLGTVLLTISIALEMFRCGFKITPVTVFLAIGAVGFLVALIYTLFFAIPFNETYVSDNSLREAYTGGVYSLCRHPGVLWFAGLSVCLWGICGDLRSGIFFIIVTLGDILYVLYQDIYVFPSTFSNYSEYKQTTPFLIPSRRAKE